MSWLDDIVGGLGDFFGSSDGIGSLLPILGGIYGANQGWTGAQRPVTGYQGGVPKYDAVRERVPGTNDPNRRPGSSAQRYFTKTRYVPRGEGPQTSRTAEELAAENARNSEFRSPAGIPSIDIDPITMARGGITNLKKGLYLNGNSDGMADKVPANIGGTQEARLSDGEFVIPADVVSHLGNGNSEAGAKTLEQMMSRVRQERTGNNKQGKEINPNKLLPR